MLAGSSTPGPRATRRCSTAGRSPRMRRSLQRLIADFLRAPHLDEEHLEREKTVILSELGEVIDSPDDLVHDHLFEAAFDGQPLGRSVLGRAETTSMQITSEDCRDWLRDELVPSRLILSASGRSNPAMSSSSPSACSATWRTGRAFRSAAAEFTGGVRNDRREFEQAHWCLGLPGLPASDPRLPALSLFVQALGGGMSSRLFQELREDRGLAYSVERLAAGLWRHRHRRIELRRRPQSRGRIHAPCARGACRRRREFGGCRAQSGARAARSRALDGHGERARPRRPDGTIDRGLRPRCSRSMNCSGNCATSMRVRHERPARRYSMAAPRSPRSVLSSPSRRDRIQDNGRRALGRLGPDRLRQRTEARALRRYQGRSSRAAGDVGAGERQSGTRTRPSCRAPTRRAAAAGSSTGRCRRHWELSRGGVRFAASLTPFRHLAFFPDMAPQWDWMRREVRPMPTSSTCSATPALARCY